MYDTSDFRNGLKIEYQGEPFMIVEFQHVKPGKGNQQGKNGGNDPWRNSNASTAGSQQDENWRQSGGTL